MSERSKNTTEEINQSKNEEARMSAEEIIKSFYRDHRDEFINFGMKYNMDKENLIDIFQDAVIIFFEQKEAGKIDQLKCTEKTYLFSLGKYKIIDFLREKNRRSDIPNELKPEVAVSPEILEEDTLSHRQKLLVSGLMQMGSKCRDIINLFYTQQLTISEIASMMGYKNENVVKAHKSRCMKKLKEIVSKMNNA